MESMQDLQSVEKQIEKISKNDKLLLNENANKDSKTFSSRRDLISGQVSKAKGLQMLPEEVAKAHINGDIHFHDLDYSPFTNYTNCCLIDIKHMQDNGFKMGNAEIEKPKSIQTAVAQITQVIANVSSSQYGGTSVDNIDKVLAEYAQMNYDKHLKDAITWDIPDKENYAIKKTEKDIYDSIQSLEYEVNTLYTSNGQTPFVSIGFGLGDSWIEKEIQRAILNVRINGLGKEKRTAIFPKLIFILKDGLNLHETDPNYDIKELALECSSKRMYPDIISYDKIKELTGSVKISMGK